MLYNQYKCLQQYVNGVAQDVYKKGDLVKTADFVSLKACEKDDGLSTNCFSWSYIQTEGTTETYIYYKIDGKSYTSRVSPACIDTPSISLAFSCGSANCTNHNWNIKTLNVKHIDTSQVVSLKEAFYYIQNLKELDLSTWDTSNVETVAGMFFDCYSLSSLDVSHFDISKVGINCRNMFFGCGKLKHIKCTQAFKDWCITNQDEIELPTAMREGGTGTWEIVG